jgi:hypothetical protein
MMMLRGPSSIQTEERNRRSRGSGEVQTRQEQVRRGTPWEVPVPRKVRRIDSDSVGWGVWRPCIGEGWAGIRFCLSSVRLLLSMANHVEAIADSKFGSGGGADLGVGEGF